MQMSQLNLKVLFVKLSDVPKWFLIFVGRYPCCGSKAVRYETIVMRSVSFTKNLIKVGHVFENFPKISSKSSTKIQKNLPVFSHAFLKVSPDFLKIYLKTI